MSFPLGGERDSEGERKEAVRKMKVPRPRGVCLHRSYRGVRFSASRVAFRWAGGSVVRNLVSLYPSRTPPLASTMEEWTQFGRFRTVNLKITQPPTLMQRSFLHL